MNSKNIIKLAVSVVPTINTGKKLTSQYVNPLLTGKSFVRKAYGTNIPSGTASVFGNSRSGTVKHKLEFSKVAMERNAFIDELKKIMKGI